MVTIKLKATTVDGYLNLLSDGAGFKAS
jgi:hypothetical protein